MSVKPTPTNEKRVVVDMRYIIYANNGDDDDRRHFQVLSFRTLTVIIFSALHHHFSLLICRVRRAAHFHLCTWCSCIVWPQPFNTILTIRNMNNKEMEKNIITKINKRQIEIGEPQRQTTSMIIIHAYIYFIFVSVACAFVKLQFVASITINKTFSHFPKKKNRKREECARKPKRKKNIRHVAHMTESFVFHSKCVFSSQALCANVHLYISHSHLRLEHRRSIPFLFLSIFFLFYRSHSALYSYFVFGFLSNMHTMISGRR